MSMSEALPAREISGAAVSPLPPAVYPDRISLSGRYAQVEPLDPASQAEELWVATQTGHEVERIWDYMGSGPFADSRTFRNWLDSCTTTTDPLFFALRDGRDGKAAGMASYLNVRPGDGVIEIGHIWLAQSLQRTRAATEALYLMMKHAMDDLGYRRLEWKCNALNTPSRRAAARFGFAYDGTFHRHMVVKGHNRDTAWFSILADEWPAIRANFETWLDPANFDENGQQIVSLSGLNRPLRPGETA